MSSFKEQNKSKMLGYFLSGCKPHGYAPTLGMELEHFIVDRKTMKNVDYYGDNGIEAILFKLCKYYDEIFYSEGHIIGLKRKDILISLEPAAQLEISISPEQDLAEIARIYSEFRNELDPILAELDYTAVTYGYAPASRISELSLLPKNRYKFMYDYFGSSGEFGRNMMKGTGALHISVDYYSEADFIQKYRLLYILLPILSLITDNSPVFEGKPYNGNLLRARIWESVDNARVVYPTDDGISFESYADFLLSSPMIVYGGNGTDRFSTETAEQLYGDALLTDEELEHILSMCFPTLRLKKYIEIRCADSMQISYALSYMALIKGLLADTDSLSELLKDCEMSEAEEVRHNLMKNGLEGIAYGQPVTEIISNMFASARSRLCTEEAEYLNTLQGLIEEHRLPKNDYMKEALI